MKVDALTVGAVGFAAFAAWYALRGNKAGAQDSDVATIYGLMSTQRHEVGNNIGANLDYMGGGLGLLPGSLQTRAPSYGLQGPNTGFWAT